MASEYVQFRPSLSYATVGAYSRISGQRRWERTPTELACLLSSRNADDTAGAGDASHHFTRHHTPCPAFIPQAPCRQHQHQQHPPQGALTRSLYAHRRLCKESTMNDSAWCVERGPRRYRPSLPTVTPGSPDGASREEKQAHGGLTRLRHRAHFDALVVVHVGGPVYGLRVSGMYGE